MVLLEKYKRVKVITESMRKEKNGTKQTFLTVSNFSVLTCAVNIK